MGETVTIQCDVPGHEDEKIEFKKKGWKFKHMRLWQAALITSDLTMSELAELVSERIESWTLTGEITDEEGEVTIGVLPFEPGAEAFDEFDQEVTNWIVLSYKTAYLEAGIPDPNVS